MALLDVINLSKAFGGVKAVQNVSFSVDARGTPLPMQGLVVELPVGEGDVVRPGQTVAVLEAMGRSAIERRPISI